MNAPVTQQSVVKESFGRFDTTLRSSRRGIPTRLPRGVLCHTLQLLKAGLVPCKLVLIRLAKGREGRKSLQKSLVP